MKSDGSTGVASLAPRAGVIDWRQVRALVELHLKQGLRPGMHAATGARVHPIRQLVFSMGVLGLFFIGNAKACVDLQSFLILLFSVTFAMAVFGAMPETLDSRRRNVEVLVSKPVDSRTALAARTLTLFYSIGIIATCFSVAPLISTHWFFSSSWSQIGGAYLMLALGAFSVVMLSLTAIIYSARWFNVDKIRGLAQVLFIIVSLGMTGLSLVSARGLALQRRGSSISLSSSMAVRFAPPAWFAGFLSGPLDLYTNIERIAAILLTGLAIIMALRLDLGKRYPDLVERLLAPDEKPARVPASVLLVERLGRIPVIGELIAPRQAMAVASMVLTLTGREVVSRLSSLTPRLLVIAFFAIGLFAGDQTISPLLIGFYGYINLISGCDLVKQSPRSEASWLFSSAPVDGGQLIRGARLAIGLKYFALPALLVAVTMFLRHPPLLALLVSIGYLVMGRCIVALTLVTKPAVPLSLEQQPAQTFLGFTFMIGISLVSTIGYALVVFAVDKLGSLGIGLSAAGIAFLSLAGYGLDRAAANRISRLEYTR